MRSRSFCSHLINEYKILKILQGSPYIPNVNFLFTAGDHNLMILDRLGPSLEDAFNCSNRMFSLNSVLLLADQMISALEFVHSRFIIHRDIKPENFLLGFEKKRNNVFLIDFSLAKRFRNYKTGEHIPYRDEKSIIGTLRYVSIFTHLGIEQSRRDDLESLAYVLLYFLRGSLPWQNIKGKTKKEKFEKIMEMKIGYTADYLCEGYPSEFAEFLNYSRGLQFEEKPDYNYIRRLFRNLLKIHDLQSKHLFDWSEKYKMKLDEIQLESLDKSNNSSNVEEEVSLKP